VTVAAHHFRGREAPERPDGLDRRFIEGLGDDELLWIDVGERDGADLGRLAETTGLAPPILARLSETIDGRRLFRAGGHVLVTLDTLDVGDDGPQARRLDVILGRNLAITIHDGPIDALDEVAEDLADVSGIGELDAGSFMTILTDAVLTTYLREIEEIERTIDKLDEQALRARTGDRFTREVVAMRRRIAKVRRSLIPNREALEPLVRPDIEVTEDLGRAWPGIVGRLERTIDGVERARASLVGSHDIYLSGVANRSNDVMKVLTLISAALLPSVVLAGIMGMNFQVSFFEEPANFFVVVAAMAIMGGAAIGVAKVRGWL
jgi:magnesium transporter